MVLLLLTIVQPGASQVAVQRVEVTLTFVDPGPHPAVIERLQATVQSVADRLLLGRPLDELASVQARLEETLSEVVARVATGYVVTSVAIDLGASATVSLRVRSVGTVVQTVEVSVDSRALHEKLRPLVSAILQGGPTQEIRALYDGVPVLAMEWAGAILEARARSVIETALPGYTATVRVTPAASARVEVTLVVRDARIIRNLSVRFRSTSIPILLLDQHAPQIASMAEPLRGVSVAFAQAHQRELEQMLNADLAIYPPAAQYQIVATVALDVAETTYLIVAADSLTFRGRVEAQLNIGPRAPGPAIVIHLGRVLIPPLEGFVETRIVPNTLGLDWDLGGQVEVSPSGVIGFNYTVVARTTTIFSRVQVGRDVGLRGAWNLTDQSFEGGLSYRINDFLASELVSTSRGEVWLRLISNF